MEPISGNAHDGEALVPMVDRLMDVHSMKPEQLTGDTAYGTGKNRKAMEEREIQLTAPLRASFNTSGKFFTNDQFEYDAEALTVTCPNNETTARRVRNNKEEGYQYIFDSKKCQLCPLLSECTKAKKRTIFISDYYDQFQRAATHNETEAAQQALQSRREIERVNNELKHILGMNDSWEKSREKRRVQGKLAAMVMNIRSTVKKLLPPVKPIQRRRSLSCT